MNTASLLHSLVIGRQTDTKIAVAPLNDGGAAIMGEVKPEKIQSVLALISALQFGGSKVCELAASAGLTEEQAKDVNEVLFALYHASRQFIDTGAVGNYGWPEDGPTPEVGGQDNVPEVDPAEAN